jgi:hypothetical protein
VRAGQCGKDRFGYEEDCDGGVLDLGGAGGGDAFGGFGRGEGEGFGGSAVCGGDERGCGFEGYACEGWKRDAEGAEDVGDREGEVVVSVEGVGCEGGEEGEVLGLLVGLDWVVVGSVGGGRTRTEMVVIMVLLLSGILS